LDEADQVYNMDGKRSGRWTPEEDALFRRLAEMPTDPEVIAAKLNRSMEAMKTRAYVLGLPRKWFKPKPLSCRAASSETHPDRNMEDGK
jgi:hypothetical protein